MAKPGLTYDIRKLNVRRLLDGTYGPLPRTPLAERLGEKGAG